MQVLTSLDRARIEELRSKGEFFWLDLSHPTDADIDALGEILGLHPLALEDTRNFDQRPKLDDYENYVLLVYYGVAHEAEEGDRSDEPPLLEVHLYISGEGVVTVRHGHCAELAAVRRRFEGGEPGAEQFVVYRILDALTDSFLPVLEHIDDAIDDLQEEMLGRPTDDQLHTMFRLRRKLVAMRRVVGPQRDIFARAVDDIANLPGLEAGQRDYFRDIYDHLIRISDLIDSYRDLLSGAMDIYLSTVSNRLNVVMKQLTTVATIFLPLTFITGFFGQNFGWMVRHINTAADFWLLGVGSVVVAVVMMVILFRRAGYLGADGA
jgi:magnesium transporter